MSDELIESLFPDHAVAFRIDICTVISTRRNTIQSDFDTNRFMVVRTQYKMKIASLKTETDCPTSFLQYNFFCGYYPLAV